MTKTKRNIKKEAKTQKEPIRILQFIGSLNLGGSQSMIMNLYRNINREKIQFDFIIDRKNETFFKKEIEQNGGKVYVFDEYFKWYNYCKYSKQWKTFFKKHSEYHIIHCHVRSVASIVLRIARSYGLKTVCHSHNISNGRGIKAIAKKMLQKKIVKYSDYLLACSKEAAVWLYGTDVANTKKCIVVRNAIDAKEYRFDAKKRKVLREELNIEDDTVLVGHVGRFVDQKNHRFMLDLARSLENTKIKLVFCGDGKEKDDIMRDAPGNVITYNDTQNANDLYSAMDAFILPSKYEGLGMVLIEAQFNGLPCIVSDVVPRESIISDGILFLPLEKERWLSVIYNISLRNNAINGLLPCADKYDINQLIPKWEGFYMELAE